MRQFGLVMARRLTSLLASSYLRRDIAPVSPPPPLELLMSKRVNPTLRRRLSDRVADVFQEACLGGDLATAEQLLGVMQDMHDRRVAAGRDRRSGDAELQRARDELATRKAVREEA